MKIDLSDGIKLAMAKKRKIKKSRKPETETYEIEVEDWEVYYHFGIAPKHLRDIAKGTYWETSNLTLVGKILSPKIKNATKAKVDLSTAPETDDHWSSKPTILSAKAIGFMEIPRGEDYLRLYLSISSRLSNNIHTAVAAGKVKYVSIFGEKLKWRHGTIFSFSISTDREDE